MKRYLLYIVCWVFAITSARSGVMKKPNANHCQIFGTIYIETNKEMADYSVYVTDSEPFADLVVYKQDNQLMADDVGLWYITDQRGFAEYTIYLEEDQNLADFIIFYTDLESFATCN